MKRYLKYLRGGNRYVNLSNRRRRIYRQHTCVELLNAGYDVVIVDNLYNASEKAVDRVKEITGKDLKFYQVDIRDREGLNEVFDKEDVESVIHFAGLKAVGESVQKPLEYYENNIGGTITLCDVMRSHGVKTLFSVLRQQYTGIRHLFRSRKSVQRVCVQIHMDGQNGC